MKKLFLIIALAVIGITAKAQAVSDMAVIPIGVTLNSIMRLTVTSGGNIEFVVNTMDQYTNGIANATPYTTTFSVSSSVNFGVTLAADNENMIGTINSSNKLPVGIIHYKINNAPTTNKAKNVDNDLTIMDNYIIGDANATDAMTGNTYDGVEIQWSLNKNSGPTTLLGSPADRYVVNAYLQLKAAN